MPSADPPSPTLRRLRLVLLSAAMALAGCAGMPGSKPPAPESSSGPVPGEAPRAATAAPAGNAGGATPARPAVPGIPDLPPDVLNAYDAAVRALNEGKFQDAESRFATLALAYPYLGGPHANLGLIYRHTQRAERAIAELELAVKCNEQQPVYWNQLGVAYREQGQFEKARAAYEKAIALDPNYAVPELNLGILFDIYLWDAKRALELYDRYLALTPGGDPMVAKWVADIKNRERAQARKEQQ